MSRFDQEISRTGTQCSKWDDMEKAYGVSPNGGLAMWVADMDFRPPEVVQDAVEQLARHGIYGYPADDQSGYIDAIRWWMDHRHGWQVRPEWILNVQGLVNGVAIAVDTFSAPGDGVAVMSPVYHSFGRVVRAAGRRLVELPLRYEGGGYDLDIPAWDSMLTGTERVLILCSPHNPGGRIWTKEELRQVGAFARRHELIVVSDEIHHDLIMPGQGPHHITACAVPELADRLITLTSASKTFNIAGAHLGNAIISDEKLRAAYKGRLGALGLSPGLFGYAMVRAAYSPEGAAWVDELCAYLDENRRVFDAALAGIAGLRSMPLQATYLAWVDFSALGMTMAEIRDRVEGQAKIAANHGESFGVGGDSFLRFNLAMPRAKIIEAGERLQRAFADVQ